MGILSSLGFKSTGKRRSKLKKLPKIPKGLAAAARRAVAKKKREGEIAKRHKEIEALRKIAGR